MTDRLKGVFVTFEQDIREDDAQATIAAIMQIRGVIDVSPSVAEIRDHTARVRARTELIRQIRELLFEEDKQMRYWNK
jgi:hypothetical protein